MILMGTNKSNHRPTVAERQRIRQQARQQLDAILREQKIERMTQSEILEDLKRRHQGDIPIPAIWGIMADRRISAATVSRGITGGAA